MKKEDKELLAVAAIAGAAILKGKRALGTGGVGISKRQIESVLRRMDPTEIFRLHAQLYGNSDRTSVHDFIQKYAPNNKVYHAAYRIAYGDMSWNNSQDLSHGSYEPLSRQKVIDFLNEQIKDPWSPYAKRPVVGKTHLWAVSPEYGWEDYNKRMLLPLEGNEEFVDKIMRVYSKYWE